MACGKYPGQMQGNLKWENIVAPSDSYAELCCVDAPKAPCGENDCSGCAEYQKADMKWYSLDYLTCTYSENQSTCKNGKFTCGEAPKCDGTDCRGCDQQCNTTTGTGCVDTWDWEAVSTD